MPKAKLNFLLINLCFAVLLFAPLPYAAHAGSAELLLDEVSKNLSRIKSVRCSFKEEKHMAMLKKPIVSEGLLIFEKPEKLRWEYTLPYSSGFTLNKSGGTSWDESQAIKRKYTLSSDPVTSSIAKQLLMWTTFDKNSIKSNYTAKQTDKRVIELTPLSDSMKGAVSKIRITFSNDAASVDSVEIFESSGDYMRTTFYDKTFNIENDSALFE